MAEAVDLPNLSPAQQQFVESVGLYFEQYQVSRIGGRLLGLLMLLHGPFTLDQMVCDITDYRFAAMLPAIAADEELLTAYAEWTCDEAAVAAIRLGGYPTFTQQDPRSSPAHANLGDTSLLTLDTTAGIMWGDSGAAQFMMRQSDLEARDFSRVAYNWDCC